MDKLSILRITCALSIAFAGDAFCENDTEKKAVVKKLADKPAKKAGKKQAKKIAKKSPEKKSEKAYSGQCPPANQSVDKVQPMTEALSSAYTTNSDFKNKLYLQFANDEEVSKALARFRPSINADASVGTNHIHSKAAPNLYPLTPKVRNEYTIHPEQAEIVVNQNLFRGGGDVANLWASESAVKAGEFGLLNAEQTTLQNAARAYMDVIFTSSAVKSYQLNVSYLGEQLKSKKAQLEVGEVTATDVASSESELAKGMAQLATAQAQLEDAKANYLQVIGERPGLLEYPKPLPDIPNCLSEIIAIALQNNPVILNALYVAKQEGYTIDASVAALWPSLDFNASAQRALNQNQGNRDQTNSAQAQLKLTVPIYNNGGADYANIRQQVEKTAAARYALEQARKSTVENATKAWDAWIAAKEQIRDLTVQVAAATKARDNAAKEAAVGERSYTEVLTFQSQLITAEVNLEQAKRDEVIAQYGIYNAMGILTAVQLKLPVAINKVQEHYQDVKWKLFGWGDSPKILEQKDEQLENAPID